MADISNGPVSTLPGAVSTSPKGTMCDDHPDRIAYRRVQGETDSFGCEYYDLCEECFKKHQEEADKPNIGCCEWCKKSGLELFPQRDYDEGMAGPVYDVCRDCIRKQLKALEEESAEYDRREEESAQERAAEEQSQREDDEWNDRREDELEPQRITDSLVKYAPAFCTAHPDRPSVSFRDYRLKPRVGYCKECDSTECAKLAPPAIDVPPEEPEQNQS